MQYLGDAKMQKSTQINRKKQGIDEEALAECDDHMKSVSYLQYLNEKQPCKGKEFRLCSDNLTLLKKHINSMKRVYGASCNICKKLTFMECQLCKKHVCFKSGKGMTSSSCCIDLYDDLMYGMGIMDHVEMFGVQRLKFKKASAPEVRKNKSHLCNLMTKYHKDIGDKY